MKAGTLGNYNSDPFFRQPSSTNVSARRLRAHIREAWDAFESHLRNSGRSFERAYHPQKGTIPSLDNLPSSDRLSIYQGTEFINYENLIGDVNSRIASNRGCEPEGMYASPVITEVFHLQTFRWKPIAEAYAKRCWNIVEAFFREALSHLAPPHIVSQILETITDDKLAATEKALMAKLDELLKPYNRGSLFVLNTRELSSRKEQAKMHRLELDSQIYPSGQHPEEHKNDAKALDVLDYVDAHYGVRGAISHSGTALTFHRSP